MSQSVRLVCGAAAAVFVAVAFAACSHATGPSLTVTVVSRTLEPSSTVANASAICCCRVRGTIKNTSSITVNVDVRFQAKDKSGTSVGTALDWVPGIAAGQSKAYDAIGFTVVCSTIDPASITNDPLAYGVYSITG